MNVWKRCAATVTAVAAWCAPAHAGVTEFTERAEWETAVGQFTTIDFTGFPEFTIITDQYEDLGVLFTDGNDTILFNNGFLNDGVGLSGRAFDDIELSFVTPHLWIAVDYPGDVRIQLFDRGALIFTSSDNFPGGGFGFFAGLVSTEFFDGVIISDPTDDAVFIDDLHFGVPAPPTLAVLAFGALAACRRRRR